MKTVIVTGGSGYIGSTIIKTFLKEGYRVVNLDYRANDLNENSYVSISIDIRDSSKLLSVFERFAPIDCVIHCAGELGIERSYAEKELFYSQIVFATDCIINAMIQYKVPRLIFSSSAAVYSENKSSISETERLNVAEMAPYCRYKYMCETKLLSISELVDVCILRYFNVYGYSNDINGAMETYLRSSNIIPRLLISAKHHVPFYINGSDYDTDDGTCVRDYVHVSDLAALHLKAYMCMQSKEWIKGNDGVYNAGSGTPYSVYGLIYVVEKVSGEKIKTIVQGNRQGDAPYLCADLGKTIRVFDWKPKRSLESHMQDMWQQYVAMPSMEYEQM